jgi:hypothetical protein
MTYTGQGRRTQAERDAVTVEIGYALASGVFAAAVVFGAVAGPALLFSLPPVAERCLALGGGALAVVVFAVRVVSVLLRFRSGQGQGRGTRRASSGPAGAQPSQPGLTSPDS